MKLNITELEKLKVSEIGSIEKARKDHLREGMINPHDHYEIQAFGKTIDVTNDVAKADVLYRNCNSQNKELWHVQGGVKCLLARRL